MLGVSNQYEAIQKSVQSDCPNPDLLLPGAFVEGDGDLFGADLVGAALDDYVCAAGGYFRWDQREGYVGF